MFFAARGSVVLGVLGLAACSGGSPAPNPQEVAVLRNAVEALRPLATPLPAPRQGDWLSQHDEAGQTFEQWLAEGPVTVREGDRKVIYVLPLGNFDATQRRIMDATAEFLGLYFGARVVTQEAAPLRDIPANARRVHPSWGVDQILTRHVLDRILLQRRPDDAAAYVALTATDLWPGAGWNFVFGQALPARRVGVWSLARNGDPDGGDAAYRLCLLRTLKTAAHEVGHIFSMDHCTAYECNLCGSNNRAESDQHPLALCPECMAKACWISASEPGPRYDALAAFCERQGLDPQRAAYERLRAAVP